MYTGFNRGNFLCFDALDKCSVEWYKKEKISLKYKKMNLRYSWIFLDFLRLFGDCEKNFKM